MTESITRAAANAIGAFARACAPVEAILSKARAIGECDYEENGIPVCNASTSTMAFIRSKAFAFDPRIQMAHIQLCTCKRQHDNTMRDEDAAIVREQVDLFTADYYSLLSKFVETHTLRLMADATQYVNSKKPEMLAKLAAMEASKIAHADQCFEKHFPAEFKQGVSRKRKADVPVEQAHAVSASDSEHKAPILDAALQRTACAIIVARTSESIRIAVAQEERSVEAKELALMANLSLINTDEDVNMAHEHAVRAAHAAVIATAAAAASFNESAYVVNGDIAKSPVYMELASDDKDAVELLMHISGGGNAKRAKLTK